MVFAESPASQCLPAVALKVDGRCVEKHQAQVGEKIPAMKEDTLFNRVFRTSGCKRVGIGLIIEFVAKKAMARYRWCKSKSSTPLMT